ncbi:hypothetical protein DPMN_182915 [Dreissena polymorpha]|uniref:Uncharacterized protein n=1 Tax=Dreissena polymorpha TaxID=45954 RepID=A0A9D3Z7X8_DREPO|nr:hypothetical protein DPMN_072272 [Dreissena polymorpha]KAH3748469.1 hypothetical protein DPMN_182915 [Dreissena polymorpha]
MTHFREEQIQRKKDRRRKMILDRRAEREALAQEIHEWEETVLFRGKKEHMKAIWEVILWHSAVKVSDLLNMTIVSRCYHLLVQSESCVVSA